MPARPKCPESSYVYECCFKGHVGAHALYFKPCSRNFISGFRRSVSGTETMHKYYEVSPDYGWGFRIFADVSSACGNVQVDTSWSYLRSKATKTLRNLVNAGGENPLNVFIPLSNDLVRQVSSLSITSKFCYHNIRLRGSYLCCSRPSGIVQAYLGARYVYIQRKDTGEGIKALVAPIGLRLTNEQLARTSAGGIDVGVRAMYNICQGFYLRGEAGVGGFAGNNKLLISSRAETGFYNNRQVDASCFAGVDAKITLGYERQCVCLNVRFELGYQTEYYFGPIRAALPTTIAGETANQAQQTNIIQDINVGFNGIFFGASVGF